MIARESLGVEIVAVNGPDDHRLADSIILASYLIYSRSNEEPEAMKKRKSSLPVDDIDYAVDLNNRWNGYSYIVTSLPNSQIRSKG